MKVFSGYRLDTVSHCLWRGDERVSLAPKAFDVLRYLVEHADRLVSQDEILEALWPGTFVNPEVVKKYILGIRKVLGDQSSKPEFVATYPRRGYQFIALVRDEVRVAPSSLSTKGIKTMVGRDSAMGKLQGTLDLALQGQRQIVFVTGEAGIGKTTLVDFFLKRTSCGKEIRIARGQCVEGFGGKEAYYPVLEALGELLRSSEDSPLVQVFSKRAPTWLVQLPSLVSAKLRDALEKEIVGTTRERMVREICEALETISLQHPLILCMEDLHWVDPSTLDFISALARRRGPAKLLLVGTYRPADVIISQSPLKLLKQDLVIHGLSQEIALERLEEADVAEYVAMEFVGADFPAAFSQLLHGHSGGNALFMTTILQDMAKRGLIRQLDNAWKLTVPLEEIALSVPETLDQLIEGQFQQLSGVEQRILRSASAAGETFSVWAITGAVELDPTVIEEACEGLAGKLQFIKFAGIHELANGEISMHYEFLHSLYREVLYRRLSEAARSRLHLLLAQRLKAFCDPCEQELATELALHFEGGHDYEQAVRYLILAAQNASGRFAYRDAIEILNHALELSEKLPSPLRNELKVQILESIGDAQFALMDLPKSAEAYEAAASHAAQAGLKTAQVHALICAMHPLGFFQPAKGLALLEQAVKMSLSLGDPLLTARVQMLTASCRLGFDEWRREDHDLSRAAKETMHHLGDPGTDPFDQIIYGHFLALCGDYQEALEILDASARRSDHGIRLIPYFGTLSGTTLALLRLGQLGKVLRITRERREFTEDNRARYWMLSIREAWLRILALDREGALRICQSVLDASVGFQPTQVLIVASIAAGYVELDRGQYRQAIKHFDRVLHPEVPKKFFLHWMWRLMAQLETANAWLLWGKLRNARAAADGFLKAALSTAEPHLQALAWEQQARLAMAENALKQAREAVQNALPIVDKFEILVARWQVHATAWELCGKAKEHRTAEAHRRLAENSILAIADSFEPDEPLRATFLVAPPVRRILEYASREGVTSVLPEKPRNV